MYCPLIFKELNQPLGLISAMLLGVLALVKFSKEIPIGDRYAVVYYGSLTHEVVKIIKDRGYALLIASPSEKAPADVLTIGYLNTLGLPIRMLEKVRKEHPEWILYTAEGEPAKYWFKTAFMCNIAVKSFQDYLMNRVKEMISRGFDGVFLDDIHEDPRYLGGPLYDTPLYDEDKYGRWLDAIVDFVKRIKEELGVIVFYNAGWSAPIKELMETVDGVLLESHPGSWRGTLEKPEYYYRDWEEIYRVSLIAQEYAKRNKIVVALSYGGSKDAEIYTFAVTRLFDFYYWYATPDLAKIIDAKVLRISLGDPLMEHAKIDGIYYRLYEKGMVAVNPSSRHYSIKIEVPWKELYDLDGRRYVISKGLLKVDLPPETGLILLKYKVR